MEKIVKDLIKLDLHIHSIYSKKDKKLVSNNLITTYQNDNNKKEIYFKLTAAREHLFLEQQARHQKYIERDITFLKWQDEQKMIVVKEFLTVIII